MAFKTPIGGGTVTLADGSSVAVNSLPSVLSWPCVSGEDRPPTFTTGAQYGTQAGMPSVIASSSGSSVKWTGAPLLSPDNKDRTRLRYWMRAAPAAGSGVWFNWGNTNNMLDALSVMHDAAAGRIYVGPTNNNHFVTVPANAYTWRYVEWILDRAAQTATINVAGASASCPCPASTYDAYQTSLTLLNNGASGALSALTIDYY